MTTPGGNDGSPFDPEQNNKGQQNNQGQSNDRQQPGSNPFQGGGQHFPGQQYSGQEYGSNQPYGAGQQYAAGSSYDSSQQYGAGQAYSYPNPSQPASGFNTQEMQSTGKGFFGALFDFNFDNFIALKFAKFIYILATIMAAATLIFGWVFPFLAALFDGSIGIAIMILLFVWIPVGLIALFQLIGIRLFLEFVVATIKTSENTSKMVHTGR